jgi:hypothetical protein
MKMMKSRRLIWARHVARMKKKRNGHKILLGKPEGKRPVGRPRDVDGRILLKCLLEKYNRVLWTGLISPRTGNSEGRM